MKVGLALLAVCLSSSSCLYRQHPLVRGGQQLSPSTVPVLLNATADELNTRIAGIYDAINSFQATMEMRANVGSVYTSAAITEITAGVEAFVLFRKPDSLRILGKYPLLGTTAFDVVSAGGGEFKMFLSAKNLFVTGSDSTPRMSKNTLENSRASEFLSAILVRPANLTAERYSCRTIRTMTKPGLSFR